MAGVARLGEGGVVRVTQVMTVARVVKVTTIVLNKLAFNPLNASNMLNVYTGIRPL